MNAFNVERSKDSFVGRVLLVLYSILAIERTKTHESKGGTAWRRKTNQELLTEGARAGAGPAH